MVEASLDERIAAVRRFNRFYTRQLGALREGWLDSAFSLAQARVLYEISRRDKVTASELTAELGLDAGYLSRILRGFETRGLISRKTSDADGRQSLVEITRRGRKAYASLEQRTVDDIGAMLGELPEREQGRLVAAMNAIEVLLGDAPETESAVGPAYILRPPRYGDLGWIVTAHAELYAREYNWREPFEGLCAQIVADFANNFDPQWERCWIAERDGKNVGCVMLVKDRPGETNPTVGRIRLLLVDPKARGIGLGARLTEECVRFAREAGYKQITLWTHSVLTAARHIYKNAGFSLTSSEKRHTWGQDVVAEFWDLTL